jgi:hypothetical protein
MLQLPGAAILRVNVAMATASRRPDLRRRSIWKSPRSWEGGEKPGSWQCGPGQVSSIWRSSSQAYSSCQVTMANGTLPDDNIPLVRVVMAERCRLAGYLLTATLVSAPMCTALAQAPEGAQPSGACYQVIAGRAGSQPAGTILLNRCSGQTWMLIRTRQSVGDGIDGGQVAYR